MLGYKKIRYFLGAEKRYKEKHREGLEMENWKIELPEKVKIIINKLHDHGYEAYAVGGCIRDSVLGRAPDDWDITTSATPLQVKEIFPRTIDTGIQHGTVTVMLSREGFEVTTYRIDGEYQDNRRPSEVHFTPELREDLRRRDFTINAMAYNDREGIVDRFGGMDDIKNKIVRCVGVPKERFGEDALRILRAVRFSAQLGFDIEENTRQAICELAPNLASISAERIQAELVKLLVSKNPHMLEIAYETGITKIILPELDKMMETVQSTPHHCYSVGKYTLLSLRHVEPDKVLRLAMLLHDVAKPRTETIDEKGMTHYYGHAEEGAAMAKNILRRLRFDNETVDKVTRLVRWHDYQIEPTARAVRHSVYKIGEDIFESLLKVRRAAIMSQSEYRRQEKLERLDAITRIFGEIIASEECVSLKTLAVTGKDIIREGIKPGRQIGEILDSLLRLVLENPEFNDKDYLLSEVRKLIAGN